MPAVTTATWVAIGALAVTTFVIRATGPVLLGNRPLPLFARRLIALLPVALMAGLVVTQAFTSGNALVADARSGGLAAAIVAILARWPMYAVLLLAAGATACLRVL